ncbi:MAG: hypothetical protein EA348_08315 [Pseudomonadaceae bacterium]|nr:MAG: hypothetical protein EA348_08315 [Pseudomonadaceae bacterium]
MSLRALFGRQDCMRIRCQKCYSRLH